MKNLINSLIIILVTTSVFGQLKSKKYIKKNKKVEAYQYGVNGIYGRGITFNSSRLYISNSDGSVYLVKDKEKGSILIFKMPNIEELRDVEVVGENILAMQSGDNGVIVQMNLNGNVKLIEAPEWKGVFLDGMDFIGERGFLMGDPVNGVFSLFHTNDGGNSWQRCKGEVNAFKGEAGFAASGSNVQMLNDSTYTFVSGGEKSRFFKSTNHGNTWKAIELPYYPGESTGPYSMCFSSDSIGVIVGGDYKDPTLKMNVCFYTYDGGDSWFNAENPTRGYRSCVFFKDDVFYSCGRNGLDFSINYGKDWTGFADGAFFSLAANETDLIATMKDGSVKFFNLIDLK
ncbi:MAG: hypothetical protein KC454_02185 [Flavobacteriales bacterium]|nr:hypothetical protein [Flavobacteriales bacterium]